MKSIQSCFLLLMLPIFLGACASTGASRPTPEPTGPEPGLYGVRDGTLVRVGGGAVGEPSAALADVTALTYDPDAGHFYGLADASSEPRLIAVDAMTGAATEIGVLEVRGLELTLAEGLAYHPQERELYGVGGKSSYASTVLFTVDPATAGGFEAARVRGTMQDEIDAMTFAGEELYAADGAGGSTAIYRVDPFTGEASRVGKPFAGTVTDLAYDPGSRRLIATSGDGGPLLAFSLSGGGLTELRAGGEPISALAFIPGDGATMFGDDFESGNSSAWSETTGNDRR